MKLKILSIETSCDNTALSIVRVNNYKISFLDSFNIEQDDLLSKFGGVFPLEASTRHIDSLKIICKNIREKIKDIDLIACTNKPGLPSSLAIGIAFAETISFITKKDVKYIDHLEAHVLSVRMFNELDFPYISFLASGGHCFVYKVNGFVNQNLQLEILSQTYDDSPGEVFDKLARALNIMPPKGSELAKLAKKGNADLRFEAKIPRTETKQMSFSGLKTHFNNLIEKYNGNFLVENVCFEIEKAIGNTLKAKIKKVLQNVNNISEINGFSFVGGVASNQRINDKLAKEVLSFKIKSFAIPSFYATDNAEMVAWACYERVLSSVV